jgi:hypothetical protein
MRTGAKICTQKELINEQIIKIDILYIKKGGKMNDIIVQNASNIVTSFDRILSDMIESIEMLQQVFKSTEDTKEEV